MTRTLLQWRILGDDLVGTCHVPAPGVWSTRAAGASPGVLLLNSGPAPRSGNSDLSARLGDRLALRGCPVFRFDLRGLGDSSGRTPVDLDSFWSDVVDGRNDDATVELIERLAREHGVERLVVGGLCAAAVPSVRALARSAVAPIGLLLLEPDFHLAPGRAPGAVDARSSSARRARRRTALGLDVRRGFARATRPLRALLGFVGLRPWSAWPADANLALIREWQAGLARGIESLVVVAAGHPNDKFVARIVASSPAAARVRVTCVRLPGTNHLFTSGDGPDAVAKAVETWVLDTLGLGSERALERASGKRP